MLSICLKPIASLTKSDCAMCIWPQDFLTPDYVFFQHTKNSIKTLRTSRALVFLCFGATKCPILSLVLSLYYHLLIFFRFSRKLSLQKMLQEYWKKSAEKWKRRRFYIIPQTLNILWIPTYITDIISVLLVCIINKRPVTSRNIVKACMLQMFKSPLFKGRWKREKWGVEKQSNVR